MAHISRTRQLAAIITAGLASLGVAQLASPAHAAKPTAASTHATSWVSRATKTGSAKPTTTLHLAVWLKQRNAAGLAARTSAIYTRGSSQYHQYLTAAQATAAYAPTQRQAAAVRRYLTGQGFHVDAVAGNRAYVNVTGTVAQAQRAFGVQINTYRYHGSTYRSNAAAPQLSGIAGNHIASVSGLDDASAYRPTVRKVTQPASSTTPYDGVCGGLGTTKTVNLINPTATRTLTGFIPCDGYTGAQLQKAYGVDRLPADAGAGQTVAIVDAYGSPTILQDANKFSEVSGLPALDSSNFRVVSPAGIGNKKESKAQDPIGWQAEVTLDVEAVHAMAPGAKIVLVAAPNNYASLDEAVNWVTLHHLANIVTNSWGLPLDLAAQGQGARDNRIFTTAAARASV